MRKTLIAALAGSTFAFGGGSALAVECVNITTIGQWQIAISCTQGDKLWTIGATDLDASVQVLFGGVLLTHNMQIIGFDTSDAADTWTINYSIAVLDPAHFFISDMFAGADNPGGGSLLAKNVTGDPGGAFALSVVDGVENPATSEKHGLTATLLSITETFSVNAGANLLSVSNTYQESSAPVPATLMLLGLGLVVLGAFERNRRMS